MGSFHLATMTLKGLFTKPETLCYPDAVKQPYPGQKGHIVNHVEDCILCSKCQKVCPCHCIDVDKAQRTWTIHPYSCILCSSCVDACPKQCLCMESSRTPISPEKHEIKLDVPERESKTA